VTTSTDVRWRGALAACLACCLVFATAGTASAEALAGASGPSAAKGPKKVTQADLTAFLAVLDSIPADASPEVAAGILFPRNEGKKNEYKRFARELDQAAAREAAKAPAAGQTQFPALRTTAAGMHAFALPAAIAVLIPITVRCVAQGLGAAGINEVITLAHKGQRATAESRVYALVGGCISALFPGPLKWVANRIKQPIAAVVLTVMIRWYA
jgi:hypothetical protein